MFNAQQFDRSADLVRSLFKVRELLHVGRPQSFDVDPADPEAIEIVDGLIHRILSKLADQASGD